MKYTLETTHTHYIIKRRGKEVSKYLIPKKQKAKDAMLHNVELEIADLNRKTMEYTLTMERQRELMSMFNLNLPTYIEN